MVNTFSFKRLRLLIIRHALKNWKLYSISFIILTVLIYFANGPRPIRNSQPFFDTYVLLLVSVGALYSGMFFKKWSDRAQGSNYLMLPATVTEKIALVFFYTVIVFVPLFTCLFYIEMYVQLKINYPNPVILFIEQSGEHSPLYTYLTEAIVPYVFFQSLFLLFQIWLKRRQTMRILIYFYCSTFFVIFGNATLLRWMSGCANVWVDKKIVLFPVTVSYSGFMESDLFTSPFIAGVSVSVVILLTVLVYMAAYHKLKEKEI